MSAATGGPRYTHKLAGATLDELLAAAARDEWPNNMCEPEWALLRDWAIAAESLATDASENRAWEAQMTELARERLPYSSWVDARGDALRKRIRARKLAQANLRYKYGYRGARRWRLIANDVRAFVEQLNLSP